MAELLGRARAMSSMVMGFQAKGRWSQLLCCSQLQAMSARQLYGSQACSHSFCTVFENTAHAHGSLTLLLVIQVSLHVWFILVSYSMYNNAALAIACAVSSMSCTRDGAQRGLCSGPGCIGFHVGVNVTCVSLQYNACKSMLNKEHTTIRRLCTMTPSNTEL